MSSFLAFIEVLVTLSVVITLVSSYLIINKLWSRRAVREVAESISISAALLGFATQVPFLLKFILIDNDVAPAIRSAISIATGVCFVMIASGLWVREYRGRSFVRLMMSALRLEGSESTDLLKALIQPTGARQLIEVFHAMAAVDKHIDAREIELIEKFARRWHVEPPKLSEGSTDETGGMMSLRAAVERYLAVSPPHEQAEELVDVLKMFVLADAHVSEEEELVLEEIGGMVMQYVGDSEFRRMFEVVIVPQNDDQIDAVQSLLPGIEPKIVRGGTVFSAGQFFSGRYAEVVCDKYIALGLFTATMDAGTVK